MNTGLHTPNSSKEHHKTTELVLSLAGLYKHRHGRQKIPGLMQEGKNKHTQFHVGHVLLHCLVLWSAIPFRIIFKDILFSSLLALKTCQCLISSLLLFFSSPPFLSCCQSLEQFLCEFTPKLNKILSASSKFTQYKHRKC